MLKKFYLLLTALFIFSFSFIWNIKAESPSLEIILFHWKWCPHCTTQMWYLEELKNNYNINISDYEVYYNADNQKLFKEYWEKFETDFRWVPVTILDWQYVVWADKTKLENIMKAYFEKQEIIKVEDENIETENQEKIIEENIETDNETTDEYENFLQDIKSSNPIIEEELELTWIFETNRIDEEENKIPQIVFFHWETCPYCKLQFEYLKELQKDYDFEILEYEVYYNEDNQKLFQDYAKKYNTQFSWVPVTIINDNIVNWFDKEHTLKLLKECPEIQAQENCEENHEEDCDCDQDVKTSIFWYEINLKQTWWLLFGIILWLIDWINPCVLWVLVFLLTYLISIWNKKKLLITWVIFSLTTFAFYFTVMLLLHKAMFDTMVVLPYLKSIQIWIWVLWIFMWIMAIKDFLWFKWGVSFWIPKSLKPTIIYIAEKWTYASAFVLAFFASIVELPCTIWIPMMYIWAIWKEVAIIPALLLYNSFYIVPVLLVIVSIYLWFDLFKSWKKEISVTSDNNRKLMKLLSWITLIWIWIWFIMQVV